MTALSAAVLTQLSPSAPDALPGKVAVRDALRDSGVRQTLRSTGWNVVKATPLDQSSERVSFYAGGQIVAEFALNRHGAVAERYGFAGQRVPYGNWIAYEPVVLVGLALLFTLMTAVLPLRSIHNLDTLAMLSLLAPVVLLAHRYVQASVLTSLPGLGYLLGRAAWNGLGRGGSGREAASSTSLFDALSVRLDPVQRENVMRILLAGVALTFVMVGISSTRAVDVLYAVMEGATRIVHGVLPYGHLTGDVVHGDTYPIFSYLAYVPVALLVPVSSVWDSVDAALAATVTAALITAAAIWAIARNRPGGRAPGDIRGLRAALTWLSFPPLLIAVSSGTSDVVLAALLAFALLVRHRPGLSTTLLAAAGWFKLAPFALVPLWLAPLRRRELILAAGAIAGFSTAMLGAVLLLGGTGGISSMLRGISYQMSRGSDQSLWSALGARSLQPLGEAAVLGLCVGAAVRLHGGQVAGERRRVAAAAAAIMIGLQLVASYWSFLYLVWVLPLLAVSLLDGASSPAPQKAPSLARRSQVAFG